MDLQDAASGIPAAAATFSCASGHPFAGRVRLHRAGDGWVVAVEGPCPSFIRVGRQTAEGILEALTRTDAGALYRLNLEFVPFYCPTCLTSYCEACWRMWHVFDEEMPGWFEETRGVCPRGHERMLSD